MLEGLHPNSVTTCPEAKTGDGEFMQVYVVRRERGGCFLILQVIIDSPHLPTAYSVMVWNENNAE